MIPAENPLRQYLRKKALVSALAALPTTDEAHSLDVWMLQELNPISRSVPKLAKALNMKSAAFPVNTGVRLGRLSYPIFMEEGLGTFWRGKLENVKSENQFLSGWGFGLKIPFGIPFDFQTAERRGALKLSGEWEGLKFSFFNLHLHSGPTETSTARRIQEIEKLLQWINDSSRDDDAIFIAGDFNAAGEHEEVKKILAAGFESVSLKDGKDLPTWDPVKNSLCNESAHMSRDATWREWDLSVKALDHVFLRRKKSRAKWHIEVALFGERPTQGNWLSDHYGLLVDISWRKAKAT